MKQKILYIGIDVDDKNFSLGIYNPITEEMSSIKCNPTFSSLMKKLKIFLKEGYELKLCYEASYIGYELSRKLKERGIECKVIAPSLTPVKPGKKVKTDRIDGEKLAYYNARGMLTEVRVPDKKDESVRSLTRSRSFMVEQRKKLKQHIISLCRMHNLNYKMETGSKNYWTKKHIKWIEGKLEELDEYLKETLRNLLLSYENMSLLIKKFEEKLKEASEEERYVKKVKALNCFRGLDTLSSMTLILEIGDVRRFCHPRKLSSYAGFDLIEYSTGGKEKKYKITKNGNKRIRTTVVEASQLLFKYPKISRRLGKAREGIDAKIIGIADRCMERLRKKYWRLLKRGKAINKIKVACAREMLGFIWEALMYVSIDCDKLNSLKI